MDSKVNNTKTMSLRDFMEESYIPHFRKFCRKSTFTSDKYRINIILSSELSDMELANIKLLDIQNFFHDIERRKNLSHATLNRYRSILSAVFNQAIDNDIISKNVIKKIKVYKEKPRNTVPKKEKIDKLIRAVKRSRNKALYIVVVLALNTGMRRGEILNLTRDNISNENIVLYDKETKSGYGRTIPMNKVLSNELSEYIKSLPANQDKLFMFKEIKQSFMYARKLADVNIRFHDLRRVFATYLKDNDVNLYDIMKLLGHCNITMTQRYLHSSDEVLYDAVNKLNFC